jgi:hypothetical protein
MQWVGEVVRAKDEMPADANAAAHLTLPALSRGSPPSPPAMTRAERAFDA